MRTFLATLLALSTCVTSIASAQDWPQWRGPFGTGESPDADPPLTWSDEENIRWKVEIPGRGNGTPIVWGEHVFVLTAEPFGEAVEVPAPNPEDAWMRPVAATHKQRFMVMALNRKDGSVAWKSVAAELLPHEGTHGDGTWASASALTDGERLYAHFGSRGLYAYSLEGEKLWEVQLGQMETRKGFGEGASPAIHDGTLVVQWDHQGPSFIVALDAKTGKEKWRTPRETITTWSTPMITEVDGEMQVIAGGTPYLRGYSLATGEELWKCSGLGPNVIPVPVRFEDTVVAMSGYRDPGMVAVQVTGAKGDVSETESVLWRKERDTSYVPSPLLLDNLLYFVKANSGILTCLDLRSGEPVYGPERLETVVNVYASPVSAKNRIYVVSRDGDTEVLSREGHAMLATNHLDDAFDASPALAGNELYLRGAQHLYCIAEE